MTIFPFLFIIVGAFATLNISTARVGELAEDFEREIPGSVDWLYKWARDEIIMDQLHAIVETGDPGGHAKIESVAFYLFSVNPHMGIDEYAEHVNRIFGPSRVSPASISWQYNVVKSTVSVPLWFYSSLSSSLAINMTREAIIQHMIRIIELMRSTGRITDTDCRFPRQSKRVRGFIYIWLRYGLPSVENPALPAIFNRQTGEYIMTFDTQKDIFRRLAISAYR